MMTRNPLGCPVWARALIVVVLHSGAAYGQEAKVHWRVDERSSLAWWQISPHLNHLWATSCPDEPSWQPGDERSSGWRYDPKRAPAHSHSNTVDTLHVPIYPRPAGEAKAICTPTVSGDMTVSDTTAWRDVQGHVSIRADRFVSGLVARDRYATKAVLQADRYPVIGFSIDSLIDVRPGDTLTAKAVGRFELRGVEAPMVVPVRAWTEEGALRVTGKFTIPAADMADVYEISRLSLGLGVGTGIWRYLHLGFDIVLLRAP